MKRKILYLDDDPACLKVFRETFSDEYEIVTATSVFQARDMLREARADVVISDQSMPEIAGERFLREVSALYPESRRMMLTGNATVAGMLGDIGYGTIEVFVTKPWTEKAMRDVLYRACVFRPWR